MVLKKFPYRFPALYESGGDIPNEADWHKYANGSCCITVLPDEILQCKTSISVTSFIKNNAVSYFANHIHRKLTGVYKNGEFAHGLKGLEQFYTTLLKTNDNSLWLQYFEMTFKGKKIECHRNDPCICGSLLKYKICHLKVFQALQSLGDKIVLTHFKLITNET
ncbi:MAG: SEC-C domain-containing protein [Bacteroidetes bacterium]|nr:SEC-C domain-containing protein [Bacteroidota bacterium]